MKVGIIGSGSVGQTLAAGFVKHGYEVYIGTRDVSKLKEWKEKNPKVTVTSTQEAAAKGDFGVLAVQGDVAVAAIAAVQKELENKLVIDACNPIAKTAPINGVFQYFTNQNDSLMQLLQRTYPKIKFVKGFNSVGVAVMVNPVFKDGKPSMFTCGNDAEAKKIAAHVFEQFGYETEDMGTADAAGAVESLCILWCLPGMKNGDWSPRAFKMLHK